MELNIVSRSGKSIIKNLEVSSSSSSSSSSGNKKESLRRNKLVHADLDENDAPLNQSEGRGSDSNDDTDGPGASVTVAELKAAFAKKLPKYSPNRQRFTFNDKSLLDDQELLSTYQIRSGDTIIFKDMGPQISWRLVFVIEYFGPILIHPLFAYFGTYIYGVESHPDLIQRLSLYLILLHFIKREFETIFIHRFSNATMPFLNVFKNCFHYWLISGLFIAWNVYQPKSHDQMVERGSLLWKEREWCTRIGLILWIFGEVSNFVTHLNLRNLRPPGTKTRQIPFGYGFHWVSCPNYFFETVAWIGYCLITFSWAAIFFTVVAFAQMYVWAVKKHKKYRRDFKDYPRGRKAMVPFIA